MTLRSRVILIVTVLVTAGVAVAAIFAYVITDRELIAETDRFLEVRAEELAAGDREPPPNSRDNDNDGRGDDSDGHDGSDGDGSDGDGSGGGSDDKQLASDPDALSQTIDRQGRITAASGTDLPVTDVDRAVAAGGSTVIRDVSIDESPHRMITLPNGRDGAVQVARSTESIDDVLGQLGWSMALVAVVVAAIAAVMGWLLMRRTTQPLEDLTAATERVAATRDLTPLDLDRNDEVGRLADSFDRMLSALALSREQQQRLVQDAAHELRTPLTSLRANIELLHRAPDLPDDDRTAVLAGLNDELIELTALFDELIELSEASSTEPDEPLDLAEIVTSAVERFERRTGRTVNADVEPTAVVGNGAALDRAITNLLGNAHKFSPADTPIDLTLVDRTLVVRDHGPGIAPDDRAHVFDRFYRAPTARSAPGSGLGLAIVKQVAEDHGGEVTVSAADGGGAVVGFTVA